MVAFAKLSLAIAACAALAACETTAQTGALECGLGGALGAYAICKAMGKSDQACAAAAAVTGVVGAGICYSYGASLDRRKKELAGHENDLNARIAYVRGLNSDAEKLNTDLGSQVAAVTKQTDAVVAQIQQKKLTAAQLAQEKSKLDGQVKKASDQLALASGALDENVAFRNKLKQPSPDLDVAIARQRQLFEQAQQKVALLSDQRARIQSA